MTHPVGLKRLLFLCTGNYNRSRFAELLFNALARESSLSWRADSRGVDVAGSRRFIKGPISREARLALEEIGLDIQADLRDPIQLSEWDLDTDLIIAVCETEHRPYIERDFHRVAERVEYWDIHDVPVTPADEALRVLEGHLRDLVERLGDEAQPIVGQQVD